MAKLFKNLEVEFARAAGRLPEMDIAAKKVQANIKAQAAKHSKTGAYVNSIKVARSKHKPSGVSDRVVYSDDDGAYAIEKGAWGVPGRFYFHNVVNRGVK